VGRQKEDAIDAQQPDARAYDARYFTTLYGAVPAQTLADKGRDMLIRRMVDRFGGHGRLLEIGCGFGYLLRRFHDDFDVCGTDISAHAAGFARRHVRGGRVVAADIQDGIPFAGRFDVILAVNVMEHLPAPATAMSAIAEHLTPGGIFVAHLPTISSPLAGWFYARSYARDVTHVFRPSGQEFNALAEATGLEAVRSLYFPFWPAALWSRLRPHPSYLAVFRRR
jgi:SAM-dependent methyltransferase